jgi:Lecithin retinol acyltransferase
MTYCKANSCYNSTNYSWKDYCSYHERCLSKLREYTSISTEAKEIETFETWFNGNCGYVITYDPYYSSPYFIWIVVYEPTVRNIRENLVAIKNKSHYSSLSGARNKAIRIKNKLQNGGWYDTPMLKVHPKAKSWEYFRDIITSPYVKSEEVGNWDSTHCVLFVYGSGTTPSDLDKHFKPLDIVKIKEAEMILGIRYYHFGIYLGDIGDGKRICEFTRENNGVRLVSWKAFLKDRIGELYRYHPAIPFKYSRKIAEQIAWAYSSSFREDQYDLRNRNCEHFANMCIYGINFSEQVDNKKEQLIVKSGVRTAGLSATGGLIAGGSVVLAPFTFGLSLIPGAIGTAAAVVGASENAEDRFTINNDKGSTIKLVNEMSESNSKLGERDNWLSDRIKTNIEVPAKEYCRIM